MNLSTYMGGQKNDNTMYFIGSQSSFLIICTKAEFFEMVDIVNNKLLCDAIRDLNRYQLRCENGELIKIPDKMITETMKIYKSRCKSETLAKVKKYLEFFSLLQIKKEYIDGFKKLQDRKVITHYKRVQGDGIVVKVEGTESGTFLYRQEFEDCISQNEWYRKQSKQKRREE